VTFPWLVSTPSRSAAGATARLDAQLRELRDRAALFFRLGYPAEVATRRLCALVAWEHDPASKHGGPHRRPAGLSDAAIAEAVRETYARRPSGSL
jgi:hypothetical protein